MQQKLRNLAHMQTWPLPQLYTYMYMNMYVLYMVTSITATLLHTVLLNLEKLHENDWLSIQIAY